MALKRPYLVAYLAALTFVLAGCGMKDEESSCRAVAAAIEAHHAGYSAALNRLKQETDAMATTRKKGRRDQLAQSLNGKLVDIVKDRQNFLTKTLWSAECPCSGERLRVLQQIASRESATLERLINAF